MNPILLDFEKLFATIKNDKNNVSHLPIIWNMVQLFERKYEEDYAISTKLLVEYIKHQYHLLESKLNPFGKDKEV